MTVIGDNGLTTGNPDATISSIDDLVGVEDEVGIDCARGGAGAASSAVTNGAALRDLVALAPRSSTPRRT